MAEADWGTELVGVGVGDDVLDVLEVIDEAAGKAVATAPWPDNAFAGRAYKNNQGKVSKSISYGRKMDA